MPAVDPHPSATSGAGGAPDGVPDGAPDVVRARPVVASRIAVALALAVLALFVVIALVMTRESAGVPFRPVDRIATVGIGVLAAAGALLYGRPRLVADRTALRTKAWAGGYRVIPWDLVTDVRFPPGARFARVTLPGEEYLSLYAVQRLDGERAVATMDRLRALHAAVRATPAPSRDEGRSVGG